MLGVVSLSAEKDARLCVGYCRVSPTDRLEFSIN
jgi:hypothetical protein